MITDEIIIDEEFATMMSALDQDEKARLQASIQQMGCTDPLTVWRKPTGERILLDGHHRHDICERMGVAFSVVELTFENRDAAKIWVIDHQLARRNITNSAKRANLAIQWAELLRSQAAANQHNANPDGSQVPLAKRVSEVSEGSTPSLGLSTPKSPPLHVREEAAKKAGVSTNTIDKVNKLKKQAPEKLAEVEAGKKSLAQAAREVDAPPVLVDEIGFPVEHEPAITAFQRRGWFEEARRALVKVEQMATAECKACPGIDLSLQTFQQHIRELKSALKFAVPHAVCQKCKGKGSGDSKRPCLCRNIGWMTKEQFLQAVTAAGFKRGNK